MMATELDELSDLIDALKNCNNNMAQDSEEFNVTMVNKTSLISCRQCPFLRI